jgi:phosphate transport system permease protein
LGLSKKENRSVSEMIRHNKRRGSSTQIIEKVVPYFLLFCGIISILTTVGIVFTLLVETFTFFNRVPFVEFITSKEWLPFYTGEDASYGIWPLVAGTLLVTGIAMILAVPIGIGSAIYLSEYASQRTRKLIKPVLEVLAGIPTIVYGFFALTFITPLLRTFIDGVMIYNALSAGLAVGVMIIPMIASLSEDAMNSVPNSIREGAYAMGATKFEVATKIVLPAAMSGIIASVVLGISRAIGETMIVAVAAGSSPKATLDPTESIQTMTAFIVQVSLGDAGYGTTIYYSIYAVGMTLFVFTLIMNLLAQYISKRFREVY